MRLLILLMAPILLVGQVSTPVKTTFTTAPQSVVSFESTIPDVPASATQLCSLGTVTVTRTSATVLTLADGASAAAGQYVQIGPKTRKLTASRTLTISSGTGSGTVEIYGFNNQSTGAFEWWVLNYTSNTLALSAGGTVTSSTGSSANVIRSQGVLLESWAIASGSWAAAVTKSYQDADDCWVDFISIANKTAGAITVTVTDGQGTPVNLLTGSSVAANSTWIFQVNGGIFFESGLKITAGTAESLDVKIRGGKLRVN